MAIEKCDVFMGFCGAFSSNIIGNCKLHLDDERALERCRYRQLVSEYKQVIFRYAELQQSEEVKNGR